MPLTSVFYDGPVTETQRAMHGAGTPNYGVYGKDDFRVSAHPTIPFAVIVAKGRAHGHRVTDIAETDQTVQCSTLSGTGAVRWDCIMVRRNWQPAAGGPSELVPVQAGATAKIPESRKQSPGVEDDQPVALVKWEGGKTAPTQIIDLRCWPSAGGLEVVDKLALGYLAEPGNAVKLGAKQWRYEAKGNGVWDWGEYPLRADGVTYTPNWTGLEYRGDTFVSKGMYWVNGDRVTVQAMFQSGAKASLGLGVVGFSLPPGLPAGKDFLQTGVAVANTSGTGGLNHSLFALVGPDQTAATIWADRSPMVTPGRAGIGWGANSSFHVQLEYRR